MPLGFAEAMLAMELANSAQKQTGGSSKHANMGELLDLKQMTDKEALKMMTHEKQRNKRRATQEKIGRGSDSGSGSEL